MHQKHLEKYTTITIGQVSRGVWNMCLLQGKLNLSVDSKGVSAQSFFTAL